MLKREEADRIEEKRRRDGISWKPEESGLISLADGICFPRSSYRPASLFLLSVMWNPGSEHFNVGVITLHVYVPVPV